MAQLVLDRRYEREGIECLHRGGRSGVRAVCAQCGAHEERFFGSATPFPANRAAVLMKERGWQAHGGRWTCPTCVEKNRKARREKPVAEKVVSLAGASAPRQPTVEDRRVIRAKLEDVYDTAKGIYSGDLNDAKIAADLGVPVAWVASIRELYGDDRCEARPLTREELAAAYADLKTADDAIKKMTAELAALAAKVGPHLSKITKAYDEARR